MGNICDSKGGPNIPPYNEEAENAVLGSVLLNNDCWGEVFANVNEEDFYINSNRIIFYGMYSLFEAGIPVDHVTLGNRLREQGQLKNIGGAIALSQLTDFVSAPSNVGHYANIVREASAIRRVIYNAQKVVYDGFKAEGIDSLSPSLESLLNAAQDLSRHRMPHNLLDIGGKVLENYRKAADGYRGIPFPWKTIDDMTAGAWPKTVTMFVARPSVGKCHKFDTPICCSDTGVYKKIEDIVKEKRSIYSRDKFGNIINIKPDAWIYTGKKKCLKIKLHSGREISQTPEHPLMTVDGWKRTDELKNGDYIEIAGVIPEPYNSIDVSEHEAILLAGILADGGVTHHCSFTKYDLEIVSVFKDAVEYFGGELVQHKNDPSYQYYAVRKNGKRGKGSNPIKDVLIGLGCELVKSKHKKIPDRVFRYSNDKLSRFLGMFWGCDGSFSLKDESISAEIGLASREMVFQLQKLHLRFGIHGYVRYKPVKLNGKIFDSWVYHVYSTCLHKIRDNICVIGKKNNIVKNIIEPNRPNIDNIPITDNIKKDIISFVGKFSDEDRIRRYIKMSNMLGMRTRISANKIYRRRTVSRRILKVFIKCFDAYFLSPLMKNHWDKIVSIEDDGINDVYDLTVNSTHSFVANDVVSHNTFVAVICARHAWMKDKRVLIVSPEMSKDEIAERFFTIHSDVSYHSVITGQLPTVMEQKFVNTINGEAGKDGLWIMDSDDDLSPRGIDAAIRACNAELVAVDSIYDLHIKGDRRERAVEALGWMKRSCKELGYSSIGFAQQNRTAELSEKKGGGARLGTIALADEIGQDVHAVYALVQTKDDKDDKVMKFKNLKLRRGQYKKPEIKVHWDFDRMEFGEIEEEENNEEEDGIPF
jgi:replicative DNA helicase